MEAEYGIRLKITGQSDFTKQVKIENGDINSLKPLLYTACEKFSKLFCEYVNSL